MYAPLSEIAKRLKLSTRHAARLARDEDWESRQGKSGQEYNLMSVAVYHAEVTKTDAFPPAKPPPKSPWQQAPQTAKDKATKHLNAVEQARLYPKHKQKIAIQHNTSTRSLQRWIETADKARQLAYRKRLNPIQAQLEALLPQYNWERKKSYAFDEKLLDYGFALANNQQRLNLSDVYRHVINEAQIRSLKAGSYDTFVRAIERHIPKSIQCAARQGLRKWEADYAPKILRRYDDMLPNFAWVLDHHVFDVFVDYHGRIIRPWITGVMDMRTRSFMGWCINLGPNSRTIILAMRHAILPKNNPDFPQHGVPESVYIDNGKDFRCKDLKGEWLDFGKIDYPDIIENFAAYGISPLYIDMKYDHKQKCWTQKRGDKNLRVKGILVGGVFARLGAASRYATAYHPWAKPIERAFRDIVQGFSRQLPGWCGSNHDQRPEKLSREIKAGKLLTLDQFRLVIEKFLIYVQNNHAHQGHAMHGKSPTQMWLELTQEIEIKTLPPRLLDFALLKKSRVKMNQWGFRLNTEPFELILPDSLEGAHIYTRIVNEWINIFYNFEMTEIYVYWQGQYMCQARHLQHASMVKPNDPNMVRGLKLQANVKKYTKQALIALQGGIGKIKDTNPFYLETPRVLAQISHQSSVDSCQSPGSQKLITDDQQPTTDVVYLSKQDRYRALLKAKAQGNGLGEADLAFMAEYETSPEYHFSKELYQTEYAFYQVQAKGA